jgi:hypothetical protein
MSFLTSHTYHHNTDDDSPRRRSLSMIHGPFHAGGQHHVAGEVIGSSSLPPGRGFPYILPSFPPHPSGNIRPRSTTWDSSMGRLSPKLSKSKSLDFTNSPGAARPGSDFTRNLSGGRFFVENGSDNSKEADRDHSSLDSAHDEKQENNSDLCPGADGDGSNSKSQTEELVGDPKTDVRTEPVSRKPEKCVKFSEDEYFDVPDMLDGDEEIVRAPSREMLQNNERAFLGQDLHPTTLAKMNPFRDLSWSLMGSCIVRTAPCFWCSKKLGISATDREIIMRLNMLCFMFCVVQILAGIFLFVVDFNSYSHDTNDDQFAGILWNLQLFVYCISVVSAVLGVWCLFAQRYLKDVNLVGSGK